MKTITEFDGFFLKRVVERHTALVAETKTPEEIEKTLSEEFKAEGDKLKFLMTSLEVIKGKHEGIKRLIVNTFNEGEKAPNNFVQKETHYFGIEYFPSAQKPKGRGGDQDGGRFDRGGKNGKRGDRKGGRDGKGGKGDGRSDRGRGPRDGASAGGRDGARDAGRDAGRGRDANRGGRTPNPISINPDTFVTGEPIGGGAGRENAQRPRQQKRPPRAPRGPIADPNQKVAVNMVDGKVKIQIVPKAASDAAPVAAQHTEAPQTESSTS